VDPGHIRQTLRSIHRYNSRRSLEEHDSVQRTYALNDESGLVICDYGKGKRPQVPFPYFAEVWTGFEYLAAALMITYGMTKEGLECVENVRRRYDGEKRNPWDESECGPHYARAMSAWSVIPALTGFRYRGPQKLLAIAPRITLPALRSFWSTAAAWGSFAHVRGRFSLAVLFGKLPLEFVELPSGAASGGSTVRLAGRSLPHEIKRDAGQATISLAAPLELGEGDQLVITV
jgi:hypothetical protein